MPNTAGQKLFRKENLHIMPEDLPYLFSSGEIMHLDPVKDRILLESLARRACGTKRRAALRCLGLTEAPEAEHDNPSEEKFRILEEQIFQLADIASYELLKEAAFDSRCAAAAFAFCRLTGTCISPTEGPYYNRSFSCGVLPCMEKEDILVLCREMVKNTGPFAAEAAQVLRSS